MLGSYRLPFFVGAAASLGGAAYVWLFLPSPTAVHQRMTQETMQDEAADSTDSTASVLSASGPAAAASSSSSSSSSSAASKGGGGGESAGGGGSSGLVAGALPRLLLLCIYLTCTCVSQGFLMVAMPP